MKSRVRRGAARECAALLLGRYAMTHQSSPVCVVEFADGQTTRMTTWSANGKPDLHRGVRLAWAALESRKRVARLSQRGGQNDASSTELLEECELPAIT